MPINREIEGDLVELAQAGEFSLIAHGCNCFCNMGSGIAPQIAKAFPDAEAEDNETATGDSSKLGTYTVGWDENAKLFIANMYTQHGYGKRNHGGVDLNYEALRDCFVMLNADWGDYSTFSVGSDFIKEEASRPIGIPLIGAGLGGGDWEVISKIINEETPDLDITLVRYNKG